ncbi:hypothetical protein [Haloarcula sp. H-GB5]
MTEDRTDLEDEAIEDFLFQFFRDEYEHDPSDISSEEEQIIGTLYQRADELFDTSKGTLGLALDFLMVAENLSQVDPWLSGFDSELTSDDVLSHYEQGATKSTLTLKHGGERESIRTVHDDVIDLFREDLQRTNFPSSPGHHTGEWERYQDLLELSFRLSRTGRYEAAQRLFDLGLERLDKRTVTRRDPPFPKPFLEILRNYERSHPDELGGSAYQAFCYGYVRTEWSHLSLRASKVRVGSSRQNRYGDIDGYLGPDLIISVEVKDRDITESDVESELGTMMTLAEQSTAISIAICRSVSEDAREKIESAGIRLLTDEDLEERLKMWDYHKQNRAVQGMIHFFSNIEENPQGAQRLLRFLEDVDPNNPALAHLDEENT